MLIQAGAFVEARDEGNSRPIEALGKMIPPAMLESEEQQVAMAAAREALEAVGERVGEVPVLDRAGLAQILASSTSAFVHLKLGAHREVSMCLCTRVRQRTRE